MNNNQSNDFLMLVDKAMQQPGRVHMKPVIEKELLHYEILFCLDRSGLLEKLTFQGGTSLRLVYGGLRFSEDLDFVGGSDFDSHHLLRIKSCIEKHIGNRYGLEVNVKEPKDMLEEPENRNIKVSKWQIRITTHPERKDLPKQMIKIEIANVPAYTRELKPLQNNYDFLPDGYSGTLIMVETLDEILADKLIAFVNCQPRIRNRDIWDLYWLKQKGAKFNLQLINRKINDYKINEKSYREKVDEMIDRLIEIIKPDSAFAEEITRFLPIDIQKITLEKQGFYSLLNSTVHEYLQKVSDRLFCQLENSSSENKQNSDIIFRVSGELNRPNFERAVIIAETWKEDENIFNLTPFVTDGKAPVLIRVSEQDKTEAAKRKKEYPDLLPKGYEIDEKLKSGEWDILFKGTP